MITIRTPLRKRSGPPNNNSVFDYTPSPVSSWRAWEPTFFTARNSTGLPTNCLAAHRQREVPRAPAGTSGRAPRVPGSQVRRSIDGLREGGKKRRAEDFSPPRSGAPEGAARACVYWLRGFSAWQVATLAIAAPAGFTRTTASSYEQKLRLPVCPSVMGLPDT